MTMNIFFLIDQMQSYGSNRIAIRQAKPKKKRNNNKINKMLKKKQYQYKQNINKIANNRIKLRPHLLYESLHQLQLVHVEHYSFQHHYDEMRFHRRIVEELDCYEDQQY